MFMFFLYFNSIPESSSEKHQETISWFSNTANVNRKTVDSERDLSSHTFRNTGTSAALYHAVELSSHWERCALLSLRLNAIREDQLQCFNSILDF